LGEFRNRASATRNNLVDNQRFVARIGECEHDFLNFVFVKGSEVVRSLVKFKFCLSKSADPPNAEQGYEC
jgi:hypothetical protein